MADSFNFFLLSTFSQIERVEQDIQALLKRFQALLIIYTDIAVILVISTWNLLNIIGIPILEKQINTTFYFFPIISLILLKLGQHKASMMAVLTYIHLTVYQINYAAQGSLVSVIGNISAACYIFFLTSSRRLYILNLAVSLVQNFVIVRDISKNFRVTLTEEQAQEIFKLQAASFLSIFLFSAVSFVSRIIQESLLQIIQSHCERTEKISQEVLQAIKAKDIFVSSLSHEIRNPLNAMKGSIDYLLNTVKDPTYIKVLENAHLSSEVLLQLLNNVLDAAKLKSDKMELLYSESNITDIIKKVIVIHSDRIKEKEISSKVYLDKKIPKTLWIDSSRLLQIIMNLVSNAIKFTPQGGKVNLSVSWSESNESVKKLLTPSHKAFAEKISLREENETIPLQNRASKYLSGNEGRKIDFSLSLAPEEYSLLQSSSPSSKMMKKIFEPKSMRHITFKNLETHQPYLFPETQENNMLPYIEERMPQANGKSKGYLKIEISDNGQGIAQDNLPNLFTMFSQGNKNVASIHGGSGLGLWICKQLCQKMGGDIEIDSKLEEGTTLVLYIPVDNSSLELSSPLTLKKPKSKNESIRALVVDDYPYNRDIHRLLLEREGVQVSVACDGKEAFEKYMMQGEGYFDMILMDIQMPEMDGFTSFRKIREWEVEKEWRRVQVYFISGNYYSEKELLAELKTKDQFESYGEVRCLKKPIDVEAIGKIVEGLMKNKKLQEIEIFPELKKWVS